MITHNKNLGIGLLSLLALCSCQKYDLFDDLAAIGKTAPHVYWELPSSSATAGDSVLFNAQYYSTEKQIKELDVWYDIIENINMSVSCPLVNTFTYNVTLNSSEIVRQSMLIAAYPHSESYWNADEKSYKLQAKFPTSRTLRLLEWKEVEEFDQEKFDKFFPDTFITSFRRNLYERMKVADLRKVMVSTETLTMEEFRDLTDYVIDANSLDTIWSLKPDAVDFVKTKFDGITFPELIYDNASQIYKVEYEKGYQLNALFRAVDVDGIEGVTETTTIDLR